MRASARSFVDGLAARANAVSQTDSASDVARRAGIRVAALREISHSLRASPSARVPDAATLATALRSETVWTYFVAEDHVWLVDLDRGTTTVDDLGPYEPLRDAIASAASLDDAALERLGKVLCPASRWTTLPATATVHLAVGRELDRVPFAALLVNGERLVQRLAIAYVPSAAVLAILKQQARDGGELAVFGDPRGDLPGARAEAIATATQFGVTPRLGAAATAAALLAAKDARLLSISSHADLTPGGASLRLADRDVTTAEILENHLAPRLVVLSSCASAAVDKDAWGALAGAFVAAGATTVVASRWALDDTIGRQLVNEVFAAGGIDHPSLALAIAQRRAIDRDTPIRAWAALVVVGLGDNPNVEKQRQ